MDSAGAEDYAGAEADPVVLHASFAIAHLNEDHADALLVMGQQLGGHPDATYARCAAADRYGIDLQLRTSRGPAGTRLAFAAPAVEGDGLSGATMEHAKRGPRGLEG